MKPSNVWDHCLLDSDLQSKLGSLNFSSWETEKSSNNAGEDVKNQSQTQKQMSDLQTSLVSAEKSCKTSLDTLDGILSILEEVEASYEDVTGRTNSLIINCENLLEQQHNLQQTVEVLKTTLKPFNEIEELGVLLGIPLESSTKNANINDSIGPNLDPRSPEFQDILNRLAFCMNNLKNRQDILEGNKYQQWLDKLQNRATSLVGRAMRELIDKAVKACSESLQQKTKNGVLVVDDQPIESSVIYQKFRSLGFRLRELGILLHRNTAAAPGEVETPHESLTKKRSFKGALGGSAGPTHADMVSKSVEYSVLQEVIQYYVVARTELLLPFLRATWQLSFANYAKEDASSGRSTPKTAGVGGAAGAEATTVGASSLCTGIRQVYSILLRVTQLEQQLFDNLFRQDPNSSTAAGGGSATTTPHPRHLTSNINSAEVNLLRTHSMDNAEASRAINAALHSSSSASLNSSSFNTHFLSMDQSELISLIETVANVTKDVLRPYIIHESEVDELCRIVSTLSEDIKSQMLAMPVPKLLLQQLLKGLDGTVNDTKERLSYCAETKLRMEVQLFEPLPSHLAYPEILEAYKKHVDEQESKRKTPKASTPSATDEHHLVLTPAGSHSSNAMAAFGEMRVEDVYQTWYPPMRHMLSLLSKMYGVVEITVFEDFARRSVNFCIAALKTGAERVKRSRLPIHGDLFLVRHLLILREQLVPFEIRMLGTEKALDFTATGSAFSRLIQNARNMWRFDATNGILQFARSGLPNMQETQIDSKKELDSILKGSCFQLKMSAVKMLMSTLDAFLAKVNAFVGEIPVGESSTGSSGRPLSSASSDADVVTTPAASSSDNRLVAATTPLLSAEAINKIKGQNFLTPPRIKEVLDGMQGALVHTGPDFKFMMTLYIDNPMARTILLKPILQECELSRRKMECVISSCLDPGEARRDLERQLKMILDSLAAQLSGN